MSEIYFNLQRIRVDIGTQEGPIGDLLKFKDFKGFNDNYEPIDKPRLVGTYILTEDCLQEDIDEALASFGDGLTIDSSNITLLSFDMFAVQTIDSTKPNYNPAVGIILYDNGQGTLIDSSDTTKGWYLTFEQASVITSIGTWFAYKTTVTDVNGICGEAGIAYDFEHFDELLLFNNVTEINTAAFHSSGIKRIDLRNIVTIHNFTFTNSSISEIKISNKLIKVRDAAFMGSNLTNVYFYGDILNYAKIQHDGYTTHFFYNRNGNLYVNDELITSIDLSNLVGALGNCCFFNTKNITNVILPSNITSIPMYSFCGCPITEILIPSNIATIGERAFSSTTLTTVTIESDSIRVENSAFNGCDRIINFPFEKVNYVGNNSFQALNKISNVKLSNATYIGNGAFAGMTSLSTFEIGDKCTYIGSEAFIYNSNSCFYTVGESNKSALSQICLNAWNGNNNAIIHFMKDIPVSSQYGWGWGTNVNFYVGDGSSLEHDTAVLEGGTYGGVEYVGYKNATNWSALYNAGRLKTWYSHEHPTT